MRTHKLLLSFFILAFGWLMIGTSYAGSDDPVEMLQNVANNMIAGLKTNQATLKTKPAVVYSLAFKYVVPHADLAEMSKRVLPPDTWNNATSAQRTQFQKEFTKTLIRTYASALTSYQDQTIKFFPIRGSYGDSVEVRSIISGSATQPINVTYRLVRKDGGSWHLYDMSVEGVSMLQSFRSQFSGMLSSGSMDQLLQRMSDHNRG